jgi:hypothetical protein
MRRRFFARLAAGGIALGGLAAGALLSPRPAPAQVLSGFDVYRSNCGGCHDLYDPEDPKRTRKEWEEILNRMVKQRGATLNKQEFAAVLNYLDSFNRPRREIQWVEVPAKSHKAVLNPADDGKLPPEWVDITVGADVVVPWGIQGNPAAKTAYLAPLKTAGEGLFPVLVDNSGIVTDGSASVRLQMVSGKGSLGAGVVFGFRNPQSFYGLRVSPRDIVLYQVQSGERSLLARAAMSVPLKQWHTLGVSITGKEVTVTLNGKPVPGLKRQLDSYRGGRMGIHTQGDTAALFDQWQVTVK